LSFGVVRDAVHGDPGRRSRRCALPDVERHACRRLGRRTVGPMERFSWEPPLSKRLTRALHDARCSQNGSPVETQWKQQGQKRTLSVVLGAGRCAHRQVDVVLDQGQSIWRSEEFRRPVPVLGFYSLSISLFGPFVPCLGDRRKFPSWRGQCMVCAAAGADVSSLDAPSIPCRAGQLQWGRRHPASSHSVLCTVTSELFPLWSVRVGFGAGKGSVSHIYFQNRTSTGPRGSRPRFGARGQRSGNRGEPMPRPHEMACSAPFSGARKRRELRKGLWGPRQARATGVTRLSRSYSWTWRVEPPIPRREIQYRDVRFSRSPMLDFVKDSGSSGG